MRRKILVPVLAAIFFFSGIMHVFAGDDLEEHRFCAQCGMDRKAYGYSRMLIQYEDGSIAAVCSLHCAAKELSVNRIRNVRSMLVADRDTRQLINAEKANWVMGGGKRGVMTQVPKWAFQNRESAAAFSRKYGGKTASWDEVFRTAQEELRNR